MSTLWQPKPYGTDKGSEMPYITHQEFKLMQGGGLTILDPASIFKRDLTSPTLDLDLVSRNQLKYRMFRYAAETYASKEYIREFNRANPKLLPIASGDKVSKLTREIQKEIPRPLM